MPPTDLLTAQQVADLLGVSKRTVHRMHDDGRLVAKHEAHGTGALLFDPADVDAYRNDAAA